MPSSTRHVARYRANRDLLIATLKKAGFTRFAPADGAVLSLCRRLGADPRQRSLLSPDARRDRRRDDPRPRFRPDPRQRLVAPQLRRRRAKTSPKPRPASPLGCQSRGSGKPSLRGARSATRQSRAEDAKEFGAQRLNTSQHRRKPCPSPGARILKHGPVSALVERVGTVQGRYASKGTPSVKPLVSSAVKRSLSLPRRGGAVYGPVSGSSKKASDLVVLPGLETAHLFGHRRDIPPGGERVQRDALGGKARFGVREDAVMKITKVWEISPPAWRIARTNMSFEVPSLARSSTKSTRASSFSSALDLRVAAKALGLLPDVDHGSDSRSAIQAANWIPAVSPPAIASEGLETRPGARSGGRPDPSTCAARAEPDQPATIE